MKRTLPGEISVSNRQKSVPVDSGRVRRAARKILRGLDIRGPELSVVIVDDPEIARLNRRYFGRNRPTNVISFPMDEGQEPLAHLRILGDVVISAETALRQAEEAGRRVEEEILFLLIHGILHLAGYDHEGPAGERRKMEEKERELFRLLNSPPRERPGTPGKKKTGAIPPRARRVAR